MNLYDIAIARKLSGGGGGSSDFSTATIVLDTTNQTSKTITLMGGADLFLVWTENVIFACDMIATDEHNQITVPLMNGQCFIGRFIALTTDQSMMSLFDVTTEGGIEYSMDENAYIVTGDGTIHGKWVSSL